MPELPEEKFSEEDFTAPGEQPVQEQQPEPPVNPEGPGESQINDETETNEEQENQQPSSEEPQSDNGAEPPVETEEEPPSEQPSPESQEPQEQNTDYIQELSKITGLELNSVNDVVDLLKEQSKIKNDPFGYLGISPQMKAAIEAEKQGVSPAKFFNLSTIDPETMDHKDLLLQQYLIDKSEDSDNERFLKMQFERDYDNKYSILNDNKILTVKRQSQLGIR